VGSDMRAPRHKRAHEFGRLHPRLTAIMSSLFLGRPTSISSQAVEPTAEARSETPQFTSSGADLVTEPLGCPMALAGVVIDRQSRPFMDEIRARVPGDS
jgi:hypothetical protein